MKTNRADNFKYPYIQVKAYEYFPNSALPNF